MLDAIDRKLLYLLDSNCRESVTRLSKALKVHRNVVLYRMKRLEERGIVRGYFAQIDTLALGLLTFRVFLRISNYTEADKEALLDALKKAPSAIWLFETRERYDIDAVFCVDSPQTFHKTVGPVLRLHNRIIAEKRIDTLVELKAFPRDYLIGRKRTPETGTTKTTAHLDAIDWSLLALLSENARTPVTSLASEIKTSVSTIIARMRRLERAGIIQGYRTFIDTKKSGFGYYKVHILLRNYSLDEYRALQTFLSQEESTVYFTTYLNGEDIEAEMHFADDQCFTRFQDTLRDKYGHIIQELHTIVFEKELLFRHMPRSRG